MPYNPAYAAKDPYYYPAPCAPEDFTSIPDYCRKHGAPLPAVATSGPNCVTTEYGGKVCAQVIQFTSRSPSGAIIKKTSIPSTGQVWEECIGNCGAGTGFFGLGGGAAQIARAVTLPAIQAAVSVVDPAFAAAYNLGQTLATQVERSQNNMSLNIGQLLGGLGSAIGGISGGAVQPYTSALGGFLQAGGQIASAFQSQPTMYVPQPASQPMTMPSSQPRAVPVQNALIVGTGAMALRSVAYEIVQKIAATLGKRFSIVTASSMIRKLAKFFTSPEAIATYLGITVGELYTLYTYQAIKTRRRMNPANAKALRRAARRIKSFHRMCGHIDLLKSRGRRHASARCVTCKRSPCRC